MRKTHILLVGLGLALACAASPGFAAEPRTNWQQSPPPINEQNPQAAILEAEKRFEAAEKEFSAAEKAEASQAFGQNQQSRQRQEAPASAQKQAQAAAPRPDATASTQPQPAQAGDPREHALQGSPETGYAGTWTEPGTGDIITSVIAPTPAPSYSQTQNYPIIVEPQVGGYWSGNGGVADSDWAGNTWRPDWSGNQGGNQGWPQWPGYPGDSSDYPAPPPPPSHGQWPGPAPSYPIHAPHNPVPPFPPGYRPLRPMPPNQGWHAGNQGWQPPANGLNPPGTANIPGYNSPPWGNGRPLGYNPLIPPPSQAPNQGMNPGMNPGGQPFPVSPANPGLQPPAGPMPNGPGPGFRMTQPGGGR